MLENLHFQNLLNKRKDSNELRQLPKHFEGIDFSTNDYLSLNKELKWLEYLKKEIPEEYIFSSLNSSRLVSGNHKIKEETELFFAEFYKAESSLFFASGYSANLSIFSSIASKQDTIIYDSDIHASIRDGLQLSYAHKLKFKHNCLSDLETKIKKAQGQVYVAVESIYSMDGKHAPLQDIVNLCNKYNAKLIVDEAHSTGLFDKHGRGLCVQLGIDDDVFIRLMTFGKAVGCHGAVVLCSEPLKQFFINFGRSFIYTTAPSAFDFLKARKSVECIAQHPEWQNEIKAKVDRFCQILNPIQNVNSNAPIVPFIHSDKSKLKSFEELGFEHGYKFKSILSPTVAKGEERIRFSIQRSHKISDFLKIGELLKSHF